MHTRTRVIVAVVAVFVGLVPQASVAKNASDHGAATGSGRPGEHWTPARVDAAVPRDLVVDERGLGYLRGRDGSLAPHGHAVAAAPGNTANDTAPPVIGTTDPSSGATIGAAYVFSAQVTDGGSGVKSVSFVIRYPNGTTQSFTAAPAGDVWSVSLQGFTDGNWSWHVVAKDFARKGGNTATSASSPFTVATSGGGGGGGGGGGAGGVVANAEWTAGGAVQTAAGRIYFEMPANTKRTRWVAYVCSGTVATDGASGRSVILTAAHCVYDDVTKTFARNVLFIPNQAGTTASGTDVNCANDPIGCWNPSFGVVDNDWASRKFPANVAWDYGYYVVPDSGAHSGSGAGGALDSAAGSLSVQFTPPSVGGLTHALGYSYDEDPRFMFCAEGMGTEGSANWWLPSCLLSGGSSGGPWVQPMDTSTGSGPIVSVNSWGYTTTPGMAGPKLSGSSASCLMSAAVSASFASATNRGMLPATC